MKIYVVLNSGREWQAAYFSYQSAELHRRTISDEDGDGIIEELDTEDLPVVQRLELGEDPHSCPGLLVIGLVGVVDLEAPGGGDVDLLHVTLSFWCRPS